MIKVHEIGKQNSILSQYLGEIRDEKIQTDPLRFRRNLERIGEVLAYEISKTLEYSEQKVVTPLGIANANLLTTQPVIASILRAGLTMHNGVLNIFDKAENAFVSAYRRETSDDSIDVQVEYKSCPDLSNKTLIIADPMLATGKSMALVFEALLNNGTPKQIHIACAIASREAIDMLVRTLPISTDIWIGAIDAKLNSKSYIIPGLGDAGDLAFGKKL